MVEVDANAEPLLSESTAKFVVMSNVLGGIRDYDRGGWLAPDAHEDAALAVMQRGNKIARHAPSTQTFGGSCALHGKRSWQLE